MDLHEAMELAARVLGMDPDVSDFDDTVLDDKLLEKFNVDLDGFAAIANALIPYTVPAQAAISGDAFQGFVHDGAFICKQPYTK